MLLVLGIATLKCYLNSCLKIVNSYFKKAEYDQTLLMSKVHEIAFVKLAVEFAVS